MPLPPYPLPGSANHNHPANRCDQEFGTVPPRPCTSSRARGANWTQPPWQERDDLGSGQRGESLFPQRVQPWHYQQGDLANGMNPRGGSSHRKPATDGAGELRPHPRAHIPTRPGSERTDQGSRPALTTASCTHHLHPVQTISPNTGPAHLPAAPPACTSEASVPRLTRDMSPACSQAFPDGPEPPLPKPRVHL